MWYNLGSYSTESADETLLQNTPGVLSSSHALWGHQTLEGAGGTCLCLISARHGSTHLRNAPGYHQRRHSLKSFPTWFFLLFLS